MYPDSFCRKIRRNLKRKRKRTSTCSPSWESESESGEKITLCLLVYKLGYHCWYEFDPDLDTSRKMRTRCRPTLLNKITYGVLPSSRFSCVALQSKIYLIGGVEFDYELCLPSSNVHIIDIGNDNNFITENNNWKWGEGTRMLGGKSMPAVEVANGKIYVFGCSTTANLHAEPSAEVYDPNSGKWDGLPSPPDDITSKGKLYHVFYEKKNKVLAFVDRFGFYYFDLTSNSWEHVGLPITKEFMSNMGRHVISGDLLLMFSLQEKTLYAYNLEKGGPNASKVIGLEEVTNAKGPFPGPAFLFSLGKEKLCLVWTVNDVYTFFSSTRYLVIHCVKFVVEDHDGELRAVVEQSNMHYLKTVGKIYDCFTIKKEKATRADTGLLDTATTHNSVSGVQQALFMTKGTLQATRHARRVYVHGFSPATNAQDIQEFFNSSIAGHSDLGLVADIYINGDERFAIVEMTSEEIASAALKLNGKLIQGQGSTVTIRRPSDYNCTRDWTFSRKKVIP